ncbi:hypothetical protein GCM10027299_58470 [Larkinella ripae]
MVNFKNFHLPDSTVRVWGLILCLIGLSTQFGQAQTGFQVSPARLFFQQKATAVQTGKIHLSNPTENRLVLQASCADWRRDSTGTKVYSTPGSLPGSCCSRIQVTPSVIELAPGEEKDVLVTIAAESQPGNGTIRNAMLFLTQNNEQELARAKGNVSQLIIKIQIGVHTYLLPDGSAHPDIDITAMNVLKPAQQYQVAVQVQNKGNALLESLLRLEYLNLETMEEVKAEPIAVNTMPKDRFRVMADVPPTLSAGKYLIVAVLDSGPGQSLKVAELETVLK